MNVPQPLLPHIAPELRRRTLVVGLGATGLSVARFFAAAGVKTAVTDTRVQPPGHDEIAARHPDVGLFLGGFDPAAFARAEQVIVSPGVSVAEPLIAAARERGVSILGDIEVFARHVQAPVFAVTGSNGKSTVTTLIGNMARRAGKAVRVGGNLGRPALDLLADGPAAAYVLELSSFQLETTTKLECAAACVLNVSPDHLDRYPGFADYAAAKERILHHARKAVLGWDDPTCRAMVRRLPAGASAVGFGVSEDDARYRLTERDGAPWLMRDGEPLLPASAIRLPGRHNHLNALAAWAMGEAMGLPDRFMAEELRSFPGLPHRAQWVAEQDGVTWINDSKGTNVGAAVAALSGLPGKSVLIAGGDGKGADFTPLKAALQAHARALVLLGRDAPVIAAAADDVIPVESVATLDEAVAAAGRWAEPGDTVLFSPACASFDQFENYAVRGEAFMDAVRGRLA